MDKDKWLTGMHSHAGQEMAIRLQRVSEASDTKNRYKNLLVVTQHLPLVSSSGLPEADYNDRLLEFDCQLISEIEKGGIVVLVETYAGKRIYYAYVADEAASKDRVSQVLADYGNSAVSDFRGGIDSEWRFYSRYLATLSL